MLLLDTNVVIGVINQRNPRIRMNFRAALGMDLQIAIPVIVLFELRYGIAKSDRAAKARGELDAFFEFGCEVLPFTPEDAAHAGDIRTHLETLGKPIGPYDVLIAAQARRAGATLVTANRQEFDRVPDLKVADWSV
ncbi:MAG: type II toxin-antitoxin system VapC family toxin [Beijerinckiaceae bacterium]